LAAQEEDAVLPLLNEGAGERRIERDDKPRAGFGALEHPIRGMRNGARLLRVRLARPTTMTSVARTIAGTSAMGMGIAETR
jgi:hypothetical protein